MCKDEIHGGIGSGQEPKSCGGEWQDKDCGAGVLDQTPCIG